MRFDILLCVVFNIIILSILIAGIFRGKKNGFLYELLKLVSVLVIGIGIYLLNPILTDLVIKVPFINNLIEKNLLTIITLKAFVFTLSFIVLYLLTTLVFILVKKHREKTVKIIINSIKDRKYVNTATMVKPTGINKKDTRKLRKQEKQFIKERKRQEKELRKLNKKQLSTKSKVFGVIFGIIISLIVGFIIMLPTKFILKEIITAQPSASDIIRGYEYTPYGQLDKLTNITEIIINR